MSAKEPNGNELIDQIGSLPTLDPFFDRNPRHFTDEQLLELIQGERQRRAIFIEKKASK